MAMNESRGSKKQKLIAATLEVRLTHVVTLAAGLAAAGFALGRFIQDERNDAERERATLRATAEKLGYRNNQLNALYNIFSEITETLSLRYVVDATLKETLRLMDAQGTVLWLVRGNQLEPAGGLTSSGRPVKGLVPRPMDEGLVGRTARRGRTLRIDDQNIDLLDETQRSQGLRSGIIVPLIVGARVVGLLNCWSTTPNRFSDDDQRILEMMASQVATAVVAADTTETSERRAHHDALTSLPNRLQLAEDLQAGLASANLGGRPVVVAMLDIDHFKRLNDDHGHRVGDITLQKVASLLSNCIRGGDRIYRYGGEEFVVVFMDAELSEAEELANRLRSATESMPFSGPSMEPVGPVTVSIGLAARPAHGDDIQSLIDLADKAMYQAKEAGRNRVVLWRDGTEAPNDAETPKPVRRHSPRSAKTRAA